MLQRLAEDFEYSYLLDLAAQRDDPCEQVAYLAAFIISGYSSTSNRTGKPFNPLLGNLEFLLIILTPNQGSWRHAFERAFL